MLPISTETADRVVGSHPPGAVVVLCNELARYSAFWMSVAQLQLPPGSITLCMSGVEFTHNLNTMIATTLREERLDWVWVLGDDHVFAPDLLLRLLDRNVECVAPHCYHRGTRPSAVAFDEQEDGAFTLRELDGSSGLITVDAAGSAGMLIRRAALERLENPWFRIGTIVSDCNGEDLDFCRRLRRAGGTVHYDLDALLGHTTAVTLYPHRLEDGRWGTRYSFPTNHDIVEPRLREHPPASFAPRAPAPPDEAP